MMPSEWAIKEARRHWERISTGLPFISLAEALDAVRAQVRRETLEEAVKIVATAGRYVYARDVAIEIRVRINQEGK